MGSCILATARLESMDQLGVDLGVLLVASLPEQSRTFVASAAVSRSFSVQLPRAFYSRVPWWDLPRFWRVTNPTTAALIAFFHKAASATSHAFNVSGTHMLTSLYMFICCFRFVYSAWSVSLHLGPGGLPPACIQFVLCDSYVGSVTSVNATAMATAKIP